MGRRKQRYIYLSIIAMFMLAAAGCWDYTEVEKRGYVLGIAIDKADTAVNGQGRNGGISHRDLEKMPVQSGTPKYTYTIQVPAIVRGQSKPAGQGGSGGGGGQQERTWDLTFTGNSFFEVNREFSTRLDYAPFFEHLQAIVISEDVAREGINRALDMILRDPEMRRRTKVFITPQKASDFLKVIPKIDDYSAMYLANLPQNAYKTSRMAHKTDLGVVAQNIHSGLDFALPRIICDKEEIRSAGTAIFKKDRMVGWLGEIDTAYVKWITNVALGGTVVIEMPGHPDEQLSLEINKIRTSVRPIMEGDEITMHINIKAGFNIGDEVSEAFVEKLSEEFLKQSEETAKDKIKGEMYDTIEYVQQQYRTDIFEFGLVIQRYAPDKWKEIKYKWDDVFPEVGTVIDLDVDINNVGLTR